jgi:hypothetical protein
MPQVLYIQPVNNTFAELYHRAAEIFNSTAPAERNSGFDLFCDASDTMPFGDFAVLVGQGVVR